MLNATGGLVGLSLLCAVPLLGIIYAGRVRSNGGLNIKKIITQRRRYVVLGACLVLTTLMTASLYLLASPDAVVTSAYNLLDDGPIQRWAAVHGLMLLWGVWEAVILAAMLYIRLRPAPMARQAKEGNGFVTTESLRRHHPMTVRPEICMAAIADEPELARRMIFTETSHPDVVSWYDRRGRKYAVTRTVK